MDPPYADQRPATLPRHKYYSPDTVSIGKPDPVNTYSDMASRQHRGYNTLGPDPRAIKRKAEPPNISDYGVAISIKGIKGKYLGFILGPHLQLKSCVVRLKPT